MATATIHLAGQPVHRANGTSSYISQAIDQRFVNCFVKRFVNPLTGKVSFALSKRPSATIQAINGSAALTGANYFSQSGNDSGHVSAWIDFPNTVHLYKGTSFSDDVSVTGPIYASRMIQFLDGASADAHMAFWVASSTGAYKNLAYNVVDGTISEMPTTPGQPIGGFAFKDGYLFFMRENGRVYNFNLNDYSQIGAAAFITNSSGVGRGVSEHKDAIVAFSENEIEFYKNAGNQTGSPLNRMDGSRITGHGIRAPSTSGSNPIFDTSYKYLRAFDTVFWINNELSSGGPGVFMLNGFQPKKISTPELDTILASSADYRDVSISGLIYLYGSPCLILFHPDASLFYFIQIDTGSWGVWSMDLEFYTSPYGLVNTMFQTSPEQFMILNTVWYKVDLVASSVYGTGGEDSAPTMTVQTSKLDMGTDKRKFVHSVRLIGDQQASGTATLEKSDDDYASWSTLGTFDMTKQEKRINRCGSHKGGRAYRLTHTASTAFRATALVIDYSVGAN